MVLMTNILMQPVLWGLLTWMKVQKYAYFIYLGYSIRKTINFAMVGQLAGWGLLGIVFLIIIGLTIKFLVEGSDLETMDMNEVKIVAGQILWKILVVAILYAVISALLYFFAGFVNMLLKETEFVPRKL